jgi:hypothetical protein
MGNFIHHTIVVTGYVDTAEIVTAHRTALELFAAGMVTAIKAAPHQGWASFAVLPDGSKEGHEGSLAGDAARDAFFAVLKGTDLDFVEVAFGGTNPDVRTRVHRHSGQDEYVDAMLAAPPLSSDE